MITYERKFWKTLKSVKFLGKNTDVSGWALLQCVSIQRGTSYEKNYNRQRPHAQGCARYTGSRGEESLGAQPCWLSAPFGKRASTSSNLLLNLGRCNWVKFTVLNFPIISLAKPPVFFQACSHVIAAFWVWHPPHRFLRLEWSSFYLSLLTSSAKFPVFFHSRSHVILARWVCHIPPNLG